MLDTHFTQFATTCFAIAPRWAGLLEEIGERLSCSKALLQLWQRYKELYEQSCRSVQLQEGKADKLLKLACSKDIADEEVSDWIQECSVSVVFWQRLVCLRVVSFGLSV